MKKSILLLLFFLCLQNTSIKAQNPSEYLPDKPGKWTYLNNVTSTETEYIAYKKTMATLAEWFHQNIPMLTNPKGYDLLATTYGQFDKYYRMDKCNYGLRDEMHFSFELFFSNGGKWTIEPPAYSFNVNDTETGHSSGGKVAWFDETKDDPTLEKAINAATVKMNGIFPAFELIRQIGPGIDLYREAENAYPHHVIIYDPEKPSYWLPVTVKELAEMYMDYYSLFKKKRNRPFDFRRAKKGSCQHPAGGVECTGFFGARIKHCFSN